MENHHEENMECPCPCHASGSTCSVCSSTGCKMKGGIGAGHKSNRDRCYDVAKGIF